MGSAVGQVPEYIEMVVRWCKQYTRMPVITKLTPNITDIRKPARAAKAGGTDAVSLINTINSITARQSRQLRARADRSTARAAHGGYCGPAVKPIALNMVAEIARDPETRGLPISGIGGITTWRDAAEFMALGAGNVQVCTAAMTYGFKIVQEMIAGLENWMDEKGHAHARRHRRPRHAQRHRLAVPQPQLRRQGAHRPGRSASNAAAATSPARTPRTRRSPQMVDGMRHFEVIEDECVGCNLCVNVCPVENCITMEPLAAGAIDQRTGKPVSPIYANWTTHPNNPAAKVAAE